MDSTRPLFFQKSRSIPSKGGPWKFFCSRVLMHLEAKLFAKNFVRKRVGNGAQTSFGHDIWLGDTNLKTCYPRLFSISIEPNTSIASMGFWDGMIWQWTFSWRQALRPRDMEEKTSLMIRLSTVTLDRHEEDSYIWTPIKGVFSQYNRQPLNWEMQDSPPS